MRAIGERSQLAEGQLESAADWAMQSTRELKGLIRMNAVGGLIGEELVAPLVFRFQQAHPYARGPAGTAPDLRQCGPLAAGAGS